jgi:hypothetical protein
MAQANYDIGAIDEGDFYCKFQLRNKEDGFIWALFAVYGPAQEDLKNDFLAEVAGVCGAETHPFIIGGDFNIMRRAEEKVMIISATGGLIYLMLS